MGTMKIYRQNETEPLEANAHFQLARRARKQMSESGNSATKARPSAAAKRDTNSEKAVSNEGAATTTAAPPYYPYMYYPPPPPYGMYMPPPYVMTQPSYSPPPVPSATMPEHMRPYLLAQQNNSTAPTRRPRLSQTVTPRKSPPKTNNNTTSSQQPGHEKTPPSSKRPVEVSQTKPKLPLPLPKRSPLQVAQLPSIGLKGRKIEQKLAKRQRVDSATYPTRLIDDDQVQSFPVGLQLDPLPESDNPSDRDWDVRPYIQHVLGYALCKMALHPALQERWHTARCVSSMLRARHDFEAFDFDDEFVHEAVQIFLGADIEDLRNDTGVFRVKGQVDTEQECHFYFVTQPGKPIQWDKLIESNEGPSKSTEQSIHISEKAFTQVDTIPGIFEKVQQSLPESEIDKRLDVLREWVTVHEKKERHRLRDNARKHAARLAAKDAATGALARRADIEEGKRQRFWNSKKPIEVFHPGANETAREALERRMVLFDTVVNDYDGYKQVLSEEDNAEVEVMLDSENRKERDYANKNIFAIRHKATCLRLAYGCALERLGGSNWSWGDIGNDICRQIGLPHKRGEGGGGNRISKYNAQFRGKEQFGLCSTTPRGHALQIPFAIQERRGVNKSGKPKTPPSNQDDESDMDLGCIDAN